jgi:exonuclease 3'-5' domain-containing protein 1
VRARRWLSLSLICLRAITPKTSPTYLIDTIRLTREALRPLFDSIESSTLTKIVFDGRMDFSELYHGYGLTMCGALDLQLADILSRRRHGEDRDDQLCRLSLYIHARSISGQSNCYFSVQKLCGLDQCLKEHDVVV